MSTGYGNSTIFRCMCPVPKVTDAGYNYTLMCAQGAKWYYPAISGGAMTEWATGTLTDTSGRVAWAVRNSKLYYMDGSTLKIMDPYAPSLASVEASAGTLPENCDLLRLYRDRLVTAQKRGQVWYMSRQGDATDWNYLADSSDAQRAIWSGVADAGTLQQPLNAIAPWGDDYCVFGCDNSLWILRGDPAFGGEIDNISRQVGIVGDDAWAFSPENDLVFVDWSGVYILPAGGNSPPVPFSQEKLPKDLWSIDAGANEVVLRYDSVHHGFLLAITPVAGTSEASPGEHWWLDWPTKSFWQFSFPWAKAPRFFEQYAWTSTYEHVLALGCDDGAARMFDDDGADDDGTAIVAKCSIGPFRVGGSDYQAGLIREIIGTLGTGSADCTWSLFGGTSAEAADDNATADRTGTWSAGRNASVHPRLRAGAAMLQISGSGLWELEGATLILQPAGKQRL
jgi:hypothetical protein